MTGAIDIDECAARIRDVRDRAVSEARAEAAAELAAMSQRAELAETELRESERDLADMAANSNRLHAIAEQMRQRADAVVAEYSEKLVAMTQRAEAAEAKLAAVPVSAIAWLMADITPADAGDVQRQYESRAAVLAWLEQQEAQP